MKYTIIVLSLILLLGAGCAVKPINDSLNLSNQDLTSLPNNLLEDTSITELDISNNQISGSLPSQIGQLKNLRTLNASNNNFTGIPAEIGQLSNLEIINFSNNQLTGLPNELGNLTNLQILDLSGNKVSEIDLEAIRKALPKTTQIIL